MRDEEDERCGGHSGGIYFTSWKCYVLRGSYLLGYIKGNYRGNTGVVIQVDKTGVKACSIRAKCIDKIHPSR